MRIYREATESDLPSICALGEEVNAVHHRAFPEIFAGAGKLDRDAGHWLNSIGRQDATTFIAQEADKVVGLVNVRMVKETHSLLQPMRFGRVGSVGVKEDRRG